MVVPSGMEGWEPTVPLSSPVLGLRDQSDRSGYWRSLEVRGGCLANQGVGGGGRRVGGGRRGGILMVFLRLLVVLVLVLVLALLLLLLLTPL